MTKILTAQAACLAFAAFATLGTACGVDALATQQYRAAHALLTARGQVLQTAASQTVVIVGRRLAKA